jgi:transposase
MDSSILVQLRQAQELQSGTASWIGIDVHKRSYSIAVQVGNQNPITWTSPPDSLQLINLIKLAELHVAGVCYEAGPTGYQLARDLRAHQLPVVVAAPSKIPRSASPGSKTDRLDCIKLAKYVSKGIAPGIVIPDIPEEAERTLIRRRFQLTDNIRRSKQRIKAMYLFHGISEPAELKKWGRKSPSVVSNAPLPYSALLTLQSHVRELEHLLSERKIVDSKLQELSQQDKHKPVVDALRSVPGVGLIVAMAFHLEIFHPERFPREEEVASYLGLAPSVHHSGLKSPRGKLLPVGQQRLRSLLIEASWMWISKDSGAAQQYRKFLSRTGLPQKAIAAMARKLAIILWRLSIEKRCYYPMAS